MTMRVGILHHQHGHPAMKLEGASRVLAQALLARRADVLRVGHARTTHARLAMLGAPLAITAVLLTQRWWCLPLLVLLAWWWAPRDSGWEWLIAVGRGLVTVEWVLVGTSAVARYRAHVLVVGALWTLGAAALGVCGSGTARRRDAYAANSPKRESAVELRKTGAPTVRRRFAMHLATDGPHTTAIRPSRRAAGTASSGLSPYEGDARR